MVKARMTPRSSSRRSRSETLGDDSPTCCARSFNEVRESLIRMSRSFLSNSSSIFHSLEKAESRLIIIRLFPHITFHNAYKPSEPHEIIMPQEISEVLSWTDTVRGTIEMTAAMAILGTIGWFVVMSGQPIMDVVFWRCAFGAVTLLVICARSGCCAAG